MTSEVQPAGTAPAEPQGSRGYERRRARRELLEAGRQGDSRPGGPRLTDKQRKQRGVGLFLRDILFIFLAALLISFLIKTFLIRSFYIPSESMMDTLHVNDRIIVNLLEPGLMPISHGDVVVFTDPANWLPVSEPVNQNPVAAAIDAALGFVGLSASDSDDHLIKRVIGMPGDTVECCNALGQMMVNGVPLEEPYTDLGDSGRATATTFDIVVPEGKLWVMGDNRYNSADSAFHYARDPETAFVPIENVVGRAVLITWPLDRWSWLDDYPLVFRGVEEAGN
jgi:signal peptidase I